MARHDEIKGAYKALGKEANFYDGMMTCSTALGTAVSKLVWSIGKEKNEAYIEKALSGIPADFFGKQPMVRLEELNRAKEEVAKAAGEKKPVTQRSFRAV